MTATHVMLEHLGADGPDPANREALDLFGRLAGSWELDMRGDPGDGTELRLLGEWHFGWVLEGRTVQDVLITRDPDGTVVGYGSTVRSFDRRRGTWWIVWQDPLAGEFAVLLAGPEDDRIVLEGQWTIAGPEHVFRWTFSEITDDSFRWQSHHRKDGEWRLMEEFLAKRVS